MNKTKLHELIECAFDHSALEEAICEKLEDYIDYEALAEEFLDLHSQDIQNYALSVALESFLELPF